MLVAEPLAQGNKKVYVTSFIRLSDRGVASHSLFGDVSRTSHLHIPDVAACRGLWRRAAKNINPRRLTS